ADSLEPVAKRHVGEDRSVCVVVEIPVGREAEIGLDHGQSATRAQCTQNLRNQRVQLFPFEMLEEIARQNEVELFGLRVLEKCQRACLMSLHPWARRFVDLWTDIHRNPPGCRNAIDKMAIARPELENRRPWWDELCEIRRQMAPERLTFRIADKSRGEVGPLSGLGHFRVLAAAHVARQTARASTGSR